MDLCSPVITFGSLQLVYFVWGISSKSSGAWCRCYVYLVDIADHRFRVEARVEPVQHVNHHHGRGDPANRGKPDDIAKQHGDVVDGLRFHGLTKPQFFRHLWRNKKILLNINGENFSSNIGKMYKAASCWEYARLPVGKTVDKWQYPGRFIGAGTISHRIHRGVCTLMVFE